MAVSWCGVVVKKKIIILGVVRCSSKKNINLECGVVEEEEKKKHEGKRAEKCDAYPIPAPVFPKNHKL